MKIAIITDLHCGPLPHYRKQDRMLGTSALDVIARFKSFVAEHSDIQCVLQLGDLVQEDVEAPSQQEDVGNLTRAVAAFSELPCPLYHVAGNHEFATLEEKEVEEILGCKKLWYSFDIGKYRAIVLLARNESPSRIVVKTEVREWLANELANTSREVLVFTHQSLADQDLRGNYWFEEIPNHCLIENRKDIRSLLASSGQVRGVFNGHVHWNNVTVHDGIPYYTIQSAVENVSWDGVPSGAFAIADITEEQISIAVHGRDPWQSTFKR